MENAFETVFSIINFFSQMIYKFIISYKYGDFNRFHAVHVFFGKMP